MSREFSCRREVILAASPEEVWEAVATRDGNAAWLFPNDIDPAAAEVRTWDPPRGLSIRHEQDQWFNALEFTIEADAGGTTRLRYLHSGIFVDDWDGQYDAVAQHTDFYLHTLGQYLAHFRGRPATYVGDVPNGIDGPPSSSAADGFARLRRALGIPEAAGAGAPVRVGLPGVPEARGVIDYRTPNFLGVRTDDALYCFFGRCAFGSPVGMSIHSFAPDIDAPALQRAWHDALHAVLD